VSAERDNTTAHPASEYESEVARTIPFHDEILRTALDVVLTVHASPQRWLDSGCGPGKLGLLIREAAPSTELWLADPSAAMLDLARARNPSLSPERFVQKPSEALPGVETFGGSFDAITAILSHHYGDTISRERALVRCSELLAPGGVLVVFENVRGETEAGHAVQRKRWAAWQRRAGRDEAAVERQLEREGKAFFPIRVSEHLALLARLGFVTDVVWRAYNQAGFYCRQ
jgi:tRNA (cmo5U34)-methyltransferase